MGMYGYGSSSAARVALLASGVPVDIIPSDASMRALYSTAMPRKMASIAIAGAGAKDLALFAAGWRLAS